MDTVANNSGQGSKSALKELLAEGQSPWLDFIRRDFLLDGSLKKLVDEDGIGGVTSNPSIFEKAMGSGEDYDQQFRQLVARGTLDANALYETMAVDDIRHAAEVLHPVFDKTRGLDGYVSLEVSPYLALKVEDTIAEARRLWSWVNRPNLMVKVPGTPECIPAIQTLIGEGININVTLLFSLDSYKQVAEAYLAGLEARQRAGQDISRISSVASFFVSRIDAVMDKKIDELVEANDPNSEALQAVRGHVAIANAKMAYEWYQKLASSDRWKSLAAAGANPQRLLWASTGTKDKQYSDVRYVEELVGRDTVNTIPPATMDAFRSHGHVRPSLTEDVEAARKIMRDAGSLGLDMVGVTRQLVEDGVRLFADAADHLLLAVSNKRAELIGNGLSTLSWKLDAELDAHVKGTLEEWRANGKLRGLWAREATLWTGADEGKWLAWLDIIAERTEHLEDLEAFQNDVKALGFQHVLLLGMGGSSLGPEVIGRTFGSQQGFPRLHVLDSTDPQQIKTFENAVDLRRTLFIVSSKSGGTLEPNILKAYFWAKMQEAVGCSQAGQHFVAVTDPNSHLQKVAEENGFWRVFLGSPEIGGRYSVLSNFGLVPAAAIGINVRAFLASTSQMVQACSAGTPPEANLGVKLGAVLGAAGFVGRDKVTIIASPGIADFGAWLEQLIAESTGKIGRGLVPIDGETLGPPNVYGQDRVFAYIRLEDAPDPAQDAAIKAIEDAGQPVIRVHLADRQQIGQQFFLWEFATAVAGSILGVNPFDQPDVEASKIRTRQLTDAAAGTGKLPDEHPFASFDGVKLFADEANAAAVGMDDLTACLKAHFSRAKPGDYVALLAYLERDAASLERLQAMRLLLRDRLHLATAAEFGPRFLHSTGQAYKGGPASGVFLQITADDRIDLSVPGAGYSFSLVKTAQARGDFDVLAERGRRALRVHLTSDVQEGLAVLHAALELALAETSPL